LDSKESTTVISATESSAQRCRNISESSVNRQLPHRLIGLFDQLQRNQQPVLQVLDQFVCFLNADGQLFLAVTTSQGRIGIAEFTEGECQIDTFIQTTNSNNMCRISYSAETDVVFMSARQVPVTAIKPRDLIASINTLNNFGLVKGTNYPLIDPVTFVAVHPTRPAIHISRSALQGSLHLVEFTDAGVVYHVLGSPVKASGDGLPGHLTACFRGGTQLGSLRRMTLSIGW
jgi:hypothetical protein